MAAYAAGASPLFKKTVALPRRQTLHMHGTSNTQTSDDVGAALPWCGRQFDDGLQ